MFKKNSTTPKWDLILQRKIKRRWNRRRWIWCKECKRGKLIPWLYVVNFELDKIFIFRPANDLNIDACYAVRKIT